MDYQEEGGSFFRDYQEEGYFHQELPGGVDSFIRDNEEEWIVSSCRDYQEEGVVSSGTTRRKV